MPAVQQVGGRGRSGCYGAEEAVDVVEKEHWCLYFQYKRERSGQ